MMAESDYDWRCDLKVLFDAIVNMFNKYNREDAEASISRIVDLKSALRTAYTTDIENNSAKPDFSDKLRRWTYIYAYLLRHVHLVYAALMKVHELKHTESLDKLTDGPIVCCVGGGPNIDALGLHIFLKVKKYNSLKEVCVLDKFDDWRKTWGEMKSSLEDQFLMPETEWVKCDLLKKITNKSKKNIRKADIITMIKTLSALAAPDETLLKICDRIMKMMKPNALLLFIDTEGSRACDLLIGARREYNDNSHEVLLHKALIATLTSEKEKIYSKVAKALIKKIEDEPSLRSGDNQMILIYRFE